MPDIILNTWYALTIWIFRKYLLIWLHQVCSCSMWDLIPFPRIEPRPFALGPWSLSHWTTREVPVIWILTTPQIGFISPIHRWGKWVIEKCKYFYGLFSFIISFYYFLFLKITNSSPLTFSKTVNPYFF